MPAVRAVVTPIWHLSAQFPHDIAGNMVNDLSNIPCCRSIGTPAYEDLNV